MALVVFRYGNLLKRDKIIMSNILKKKKKKRREGVLAWEHGLMSCFNYARRINSLYYDSDTKIG